MENRYEHTLPVKTVFWNVPNQPFKKSHLGAVYLQKRSNGDVPDTINPRQQAPPGVAGRKKVTKGNKVLAIGALSGAHE